MNITTENYEAYLLDLIEGTISEKDKADLENFLCQNPNLRQQIAKYDPTLMFEADSTVVFENKKSLMRKKPKVIYLALRYASMAACFTALITVGFWLFSTQNSTTNNQSTKMAKAIEPKATQILSSSEPIEQANPLIAKKEAIEQANKTPLAITKQIEQAPIATKVEPTITYSNNLVVYEVNNLVEYEFRSNNLVIYETNTLVENDTIAINTFLNRRVGELKKVGQGVSDKLTAVVPNPIRKLFNI
jgi:cytoskeletal protein RodZ